MRAPCAEWHDARMRTSGTGILAALGACLACSGAAADWYISGRVVDEAGEPLPDAVVEVSGAAVPVDAGGAFRVDAVTARLAVIAVRADGYYGTIHALDESDAMSGRTDELVIELVARRPARRLLLFAGDAMLARRFFEPRDGEPVLVRQGRELEDGSELLKPIRPYVELADFASVNVETQMSASKLSDRLPKSYTFWSPPELAAVLRGAGFDYAALGNNHTWDYQEQGLAPTLAALDAAGLAWSGAGMDEANARKGRAVDIGGQPYRFLSYVGWAGTFSPSQAASGPKGGAALGGSEVFAEDLGRVAGGEVAVLQYHSGIEYSEAPAVSERLRLREAIDHGADIAIGHHPHVIQGLEIYRGRLIAYSMGNFLFDQFDYSTQLAMLLYVWMDGEELHRVEVVPIHINGYVPTPATGRFAWAVLHRLARISRPLGTCLRPDATHAVVERCDESRAAGPLVVDIGEADPTTAPVHLDTMGLLPLQPVVFRAPRHQYRVGTDILDRGDFEYVGLFGTSDRAWIRDERVTFDQTGSVSLRVDVPAGESVRTGMKVFERVFTVSNPTTVTGRIRADADVTVEFRLQCRRTDDSLDDALASGPQTVVGSVRVPAGGWRVFAFDFDQPRVSTQSVRLLVDVRNPDRRRPATAWMDDLAWIEWRTPWFGGDGRSPAEFATHVQFSPRPGE